MTYHKTPVDRMDADSQADLVDQAQYAVEAAEERENSDFITENTTERYDVESGTFKSASY